MPTRLWAALALTAGALGCRAQMQPLPDLEGGVELALRRGGAWSTITVRPPHVIGPRVTLEINKKEITGTIDGQGLKLTLEAGGFKGHGPNGPVAVDVDGNADQLVIEGTWNGGRVHFDITLDHVKGSLPLLQGRRFSQDFYCQYVLDHKEADGARLGTSICNGLPEDTRLEVPSRVQGWLTREELAVVLLALFSSPPFSNAEVGG
jgi:hypothetical protein